MTSSITPALQRMRARYEKAVAEEQTAKPEPEVGTELMPAPTAAEAKAARWIQAARDTESASFERDDLESVIKYLATPEDHPDGEVFSKEE